MNRFNLTFSGEFIEGHDRELAKARMAQLLEIDDSDLLQRGFSGERIVLRRNLERREAAELYARLRRIGVHSELVKIGERGDLHGGEKSSSVASQQAQEPQAAPADEHIEPAPPRKVRVQEAPAAPVTTTGQRTNVAGKSPDNDRKPAVRTTAASKGAPTQAKAAGKAAEARRADLAAQKSLQGEEAAQLEAKEKALKKALKIKQKEAAKRNRASERARQQTLAREASHKAKLEAVRQKAQQEMAKARANAALAAEQAERERKAAEAALKRAQEQAQAQAEREEQIAQRRAMEEQAIQRGAAELAQKPSLKPVDARVRTRMETPSRQRRSAEAGDGTRRRRQPGAPNLYSLTPFRNTQEIRARAARSQNMMRRAFIGAAGALAAALLVALRLFTLAGEPLSTGAETIAVSPRENPLLLVGDHLLLHDRAGAARADLELRQLGLAELHAPMAFDSAGNLLAPGLLSNTPAGAAQAAPAQLLRCNLDEGVCAAFPGALAATKVSALAVHPLDGTLFVADSGSGELLKVSADGEVLARAALDLPANPVLRLDSGLLLMNSVAGPAVRILRYEDEAFGQQLDEILLLPPDADLASFTGVRDFVWSGEHWWVLLEQAGASSGQLHRFDAQWQFVDSPALTTGSRPTQLASWGNRVLVADGSRIPIQRFSSTGAAEAPLVSTALVELLDGQAHRASLVQLGWRTGLALCLLAAVAGLCIGVLHRLRSQVYRSCRERGAEPIDEIVDAIDWVELAPGRSEGLRKTGIAYAVLTLALILGAIGLGASSLQLAALLAALTGPAVALLLLQRSDPGHIGTRDRELVLVDHAGMYHLGTGSRIHWRGPFLMLDDVTVFTGAPLLPGFAPAGIAQRVVPAATEGVKVDRKIVTVKLLQGRHPLALGGVAILAAAAAAVALLSLQGIF